MFCMLIAGCVNNTIKDELPQKACDTLGQCMASIMSKVKMNWDEPLHDGSPVVTLKVNIDVAGNLISATVEKASGNEEFDQSIVEAFKKSSPFLEVVGTNPETSYALSGVIFRVYPQHN